MEAKFFPSKTHSQPRIYAYSDSNPQYNGLLKIGYTNQSVAERVAQQYPTKAPGKIPYTIELDMPAIRNDGSYFTDHDVHRYLRDRDFSNPEGEWFRCAVSDVTAAVKSLTDRTPGIDGRPYDFSMRPEQREAVRRAAEHMRSFKAEEGQTPHFLWNAKMRFGKTFAAYQLALAMNWRRVLVITFKPAVQNAWQEDLLTHRDFVGWQFIHKDNLSSIDSSKPFVCFGSFQDYLGKNSAGGIKLKNEWVHEFNWDCVIFDEYHYGSWRAKAKDLFDEEDRQEQKAQQGEGLEHFDKDIMPITTHACLYLSGTPFRAIGAGEFIEEEIFNWTYADEQKAKKEWQGADNPYSALPQMVLMTYELPDDIKEIAKEGEFDEFDLNEFFKAEGEKANAAFIHKDEVQKWLNLIRGSHRETTRDNLKLKAKKPPLPFSDKRLLPLLNHTFWFLPTVASCHAMANLLKEGDNVFYHDYKIIVAAGKEAGIGVKALDPVRNAMDDPLSSKTITLSCGKLTTGVSVKPWAGIFMLRNLSSPETYFQAAFRVQTPWEIVNPDGQSPNDKEIIKQVCYVFDFAPTRALRQIADYSSQLNPTESDPEKQVAEFIKFLPVLAYDGSSMKQIDAVGILDYAASKTTATLLARKWESALLVNVDNETLKKLINNEAAMQALMSIEGFRSLNQDIETIINQSDSIKKTKEKANEKELTKKQKKQLTEDEKKEKSLRKQVQEKLIKFATRIPVFMYLTDYREHTLKDVITQLEPTLFKKVTGLSIRDFDLLVNLNLFNSSLMNAAVYQFKRYENSSLIYTGIIKHKHKHVGLYDVNVLNPDIESDN